MCIQDCGVCTDQLIIISGQNHPTMRDANHGAMVLERFRIEFEPPSLTEGYDRILSLQASERTTAEYSSSDLSAIIDRLRLSLPDPSSTANTFSSSRPRGDWRNTGRGGLPPTRNRGRGQRLAYASSTRGHGSTSRGRGSQSDDWRKKVSPSS